VAAVVCWQVAQAVAGVAAEADCAEVGETMSPTEADAVSPMVAGAVGRSIHAVVTVMVYELVAEVMCVTMCEAVAVMVTAMVSGTKTQVPVSMQGSAPDTGPARARERAIGTLIEQRPG
jgi:hypothetical protein